AKEAEATAGEKKEVEQKESGTAAGIFGALSTEAEQAMRTRITSTPPHPYRLTLEQSVELGMFNSREYQDRRENLYLTALPVTSERFSFAAQFFATEQAVYTYPGRQAVTGPQNNWSLSSDVGFHKLLPTGAVLLYRIANQTVFNLSSGARQSLSSISNMSLDIVQPLLRGGGRAVTLEPLTQAERNLLYEIRSFARFRKEFFVAIAGGGGGSITGGTFQPTGLIALTPYTPGAGVGASPLLPGVVMFPVNGETVTPGPSGRIAGSAALAAPVAGYLGTNLQ